MSVFDSKYVIDGAAQELTPSQILEGYRQGGEGFGKTVCSQIVDESVDQDPGVLDVDPEKVDEYLNAVLSCSDGVQLPFAGENTRLAMTQALIDAMWRKGHFGLGNILLDLKWKWNSSRMGSMAAFYDSVLQAGDVLDSLSLRLGDYSCVDGLPKVDVGVGLCPECGDDILSDAPYTFSDASMSEERAVQGKLVPDPKSWVVYVPFDTPEYRLGGSLLSRALGFCGGAGHTLDDPDYFMDCYEVGRELVEDRILLSGATVGRGGLLAALKRMCSPEVGMDVNLSDLMKAYPKSGIVRVLFAEVPGVLIQIKDLDFDYLDAELLLQDVAFFPLGHPLPGTDAVHIKSSAKSGLQNILESLIRNQCGEGED